MICGVGMLISVAIKAGTIKIMAAWIGANIPWALVPVAMCVVGAIMSLFSSTLGVVTPALFPLVPALAASSGINDLARGMDGAKELKTSQFGAAIIANM